jgi:Protein of unknown function (DUF5672)
MLTRRKKVVVAIPVYKREPSELEMFSFARALNVLGNHPICLFYPQGLDLKVYQKKATELKVSIEFKAFAEKYFIGIEGYNQLMLSFDFYYTFTKYEYMLLYQLDAFVFEDQLVQWCNKGYDYIGAPWFKNHDYLYQSREIVGVGNGGFSLRNITSFLNIIRIKPYYCLSEARDYYAVNSISRLGRIKKIGDIVKYLWLGKYHENEILRDYDRFEDLFWGEEAVKFYHKFKTAPYYEALSFSFECNPRYCYELNQNRLPFGCHGWYKYDLDFWRQFINVIKL